jgi:tRNA pseudouridine55 synthase
LRRTRVGPLDLAGSVTLAQLETMNEAERLACLQPVDTLLRSLPRVDLEPAAAQRFQHGNPVDFPVGVCGAVRVYVDGRLAGLGEPGRGGRLWPKRLVQLA